MRTGVYESAILINAALDDQQIDAILTKIKDFIISNGGTIREIENWGRKRLAYPVAKSKIGYYAIYRFDAPRDMVAKLERIYLLDEQILRHLTLNLSNDAIEQLEKNKTLSATLKEDITSEIVEAPIASEELDVENEENDN
ncbi:MAG TPA: 30S ribosomal protein S6 [Ignavibacteriaceae bacterium]|jgi:small subunit ribosomal protein S6|nr:MAG: 30S ribosomal protein S6 [Ignavibacteria bacterium ADurb.Bin266]OQY71597.1 MAG: 30S ribosomal protein S6 [Ignavibacteriales bacterium UTCHB2]HQF43142.1 30S ribosomal protein S6 [Ignavibacteriaceae bacterium]HQI41449.1 30S ribosomal protein S6 [Ignavibacteriaceae bacterium]HQJ46370.1 30S ribosomal protein S6 [Ignavibacteriaceae bacterium]